MPYGSQAPFVARNQQQHEQPHDTGSSDATRAPSGYSRDNQKESNWDIGDPVASEGGESPHAQWRQQHSNNSSEQITASFLGKKGVSGPRNAGATTPGYGSEGGGKTVSTPVSRMIYLKVETTLEICHATVFCCHCD